MPRRPHRAILYALVGLLIAGVLFALLSTRTGNLGLLGIVMTLGVEAIFFILAVYVAEPTVTEDSSQAHTPVDASPARPRRVLSRAWAVSLLSLAILVFTFVVSIFFDSFNLLLADLIALGELRIITQRADLTLQLTVGGYFAFLFWFPAIFVTGFQVGRRSVALSYWDCLASAFMSLGVLVFLIFVVEVWSGTLSIELLFTMMFNAGSEQQVRLVPERAVFVGLLILVAVAVVSIVAALVWIAAKLGRRSDRESGCRSLFPADIVGPSPQNPETARCRPTT
ncbi:MAG: hypothetical protein ACJASC_002557 [Limimaricola cinnabarinus]|jgi:hypothetical protein|uniref:hypothetical protein n=1 Tax=Limimaricola cinnabarinus TaxID=1125964 RepID=UPI0039E48496